MKLFIQRIILFSIPFMLLIGAFVYLDLFRIFNHYDDYSKGSRIGINRGFVSTMTYINQKDTYHYDSFIFGNSRSIAYYEEEWRKYIPQESSVYHFDASGGSVAGLYYKVKYIDEHNGHLNNALFVLDHDLLSQTELKGYLFRTPPVLEDYKNLSPFLLDHFSAFIDFKFIFALIDFNITHEYKEYMGNYISAREKLVRLKSNEARWDYNEQEIQNGTYYTEERLKVFEDWQHPDSLLLPVIDDERKIYLQETAKILDKHHTSFKVVISPLFDQIRLNTDDLMFLKETFGKGNVYDFSGPNKRNSDYHNFYENSHYRPCVANDILKIIYSK